MWPAVPAALGAVIICMLPYGTAAEGGAAFVTFFSHTHDARNHLSTSEDKGTTRKAGKQARRKRVEGRANASALSTRVTRRRSARIRAGMERFFSMIPIGNLVHRGAEKCRRCPLPLYPVRTTFHFVGTISRPDGSHRAVRRRIAGSLSQSSVYRYIGSTTMA